MSPPRKWRLTGPIELEPTEIENLTPRQAGRAEFKLRQRQYEGMTAKRRSAAITRRHGGWEPGSYAAHSGKRELEMPKGVARLAEGSVRRGAYALDVESVLDHSTVIGSPPVDRKLGEPAFLRVEEQGPREVNIVELVRPQRTSTTRERVRRPETIDEVMSSNLERAILESLRSEYLPDECEREEATGDHGEDEWELADGSVFSFDMMSVASSV